MKWFKKLLGLLLALIIIVTIALFIVINLFGPSPLNKYTKNGNLALPGLKTPVTVHRDEKGMAFIYAQNKEDLFMAQGFVTAQDRLFQMELTKLFASGRLAELAGEKARDLDIKMRTLGFYRNAKNMPNCSMIKRGLLCRNTWTVSTRLSRPDRKAFTSNSNWPG